MGKMDLNYTDGKANSKAVSIDNEGNITDLNSDDGQFRDGKKGSRPPPIEVWVQSVKHSFITCLLTTTIMIFYLFYR